MVKRDYNSKMIRLDNMNCFNNIVKEVAYIEQRNESNIIEQTLYEKYLPKHEEAKKWCERYLYDDDFGIIPTLKVIFSTLAIGVGGKANYTNTVELVKYTAKLLLKDNGIRNYVKGDLISPFSNFVLMLKNLQNADNNLAKTYKYACDLFDSYSKDKSSITAYNLFHMVLDGWDVVKKYTTTYWLLAEIIDMQEKRIDNPEERKELREILIKMSNDWIVNDGMKKELLEGNEESNFVRISNGIVKYPKDYPLIEFDDKDEASYVTVVSTYGGSKYGISNFVVVSNKHNTAFTETEKQKIYELCKEKCPVFELVMLCQELPVDECPTIGMFSIGEENDVDYGIVQFLKTS